MPKFLKFLFTLIIFLSIFTTLSAQYSINYQELINKYQSGRFNEIIQIFDQNKSLLKETPYKARIYNLVGNTYYQLGNYALSENYFNRALQIFRNDTTKIVRDYIDILLNQARLYSTLKRENEIQNILSLIKTNNISDSVVVCYQKLFEIYLQLSEGNYNWSDESNAVQKFCGGQDNIFEFATFLNQEAILAINRNDFVNAKNLLLKSITMLQTNGFQNSFMNLQILNNLAVLYSKTGNYRAAIKTYKEVISQKEKRKLSNYSIGLTLYNLANLYATVNNITEAKQNYYRYLDYLYEDIFNSFLVLSENEKLQYWKNIENRINTIYFFILKNYQFDNSLLHLLFDLRIKTKGINLKFLRNTRAIVDQLNDPFVNLLKKQWFSIRDSIASYILKDSFYSSSLNELLQKKNSIERKLTKFIFNKRAIFKDYSIEDIRLEINEALVETIRLDFRDKVYYLYLIIDNNKIPKLVVSEKGQELETKYYNNFQFSLLNNLEDKLSFNAYWSKIHDQIKNKKRIFFDPDGIYYKLNPEVFTAPNSNFIVDKSQIVFINNLEFLFRKKNDLSDLSKLKDAVFIGASNFWDLDDNKINKIKLDEKIKSSNKKKLFQILIGLGKLDETADEIKRISKISNDKSIKTEVFLDSLATEENLKKIKSPSILHIATHGIFLETNENFQSRNYLNNEPTFSTGLALTGIKRNLFLSNKKYSSNDGWFTGFEAFDLDLQKTQLVVLSACESGLGEIKSGEGVYGFQTSLFAAGAKNILLSLWKVDDKITKEFMESFYSELYKNNNINDAYYNSKLKIKKQYKNPLYWAAFILINN